VIVRKSEVPTPPVNMDSRGGSACSILLTWKLFIFHLLKSPSSSDYVINLMWGVFFMSLS